MKVKDKVTGNIVESDQKFVTDIWKAKPDRYVVAPDKPAKDEKPPKAPEPDKPAKDEKPPKAPEPDKPAKDEKPVTESVDEKPAGDTAEVKK